MSNFIKKIKNSKKQRSRLTYNTGFNNSKRSKISRRNKSSVKVNNTKKPNNVEKTINNQFPTLSKKNNN